MTLFEKIADWAFSGLIHRQRQQTRAYAALTLSIWKKLPEPTRFEGICDVIDAANFVIEEDARVGVDNWTTDTARLIASLQGKGQDRE